MPIFARKRGSYRWRGVVRFEGKTKTRWFGTTKEDERNAIIWEAETLKDLKKRFREGVVKNITLADWHREYLDWVQKNRANKTYDEKYSAFERFLDALKDRTLVEEIQPSTVLGFLVDQELERSGNAANKDRKNLSAGWNWAKSFIAGWPLNYAHPNPFLAVPRKKEIRQARYIPPADDFWGVYDNSSGQDRVILTAAYFLAARRGELWKLKWSEDIDLQDKRVRLGTQKTKDGIWKFVWIPMAEDLHQALLWQWKNVRTTAHDYVFWSQAENQHKGNPFVCRQKWMITACADVGVKAFGLHAIRHRRATDLYLDGFSLSKIQKLLRHDSPSTTERYLKAIGLDTSDLRQVVDSSSRKKPRSEVKKNDK